jgi:hypothetical protein
MKKYILDFLDQIVDEIDLVCEDMEQKGNDYQSYERNKHKLIKIGNELSDLIDELNYEHYG